MRLDELKERMRELGVEPKRSLGQNFLIHEGTIDKIITAAASFSPEEIVEVGPGLGALTEDLIRHFPKRTLIELDRKFAEYWRARGEVVSEADALDLDWEQLDVGAGSVLVSNLPYQIGSRLVIEISTGGPRISGMVLMFQKEVAERIAAKPKGKEYGLLSVVAQSYWEISRVADVGPSGFYPPPQVASRVLRFKRLGGTGAAHENPQAGGEFVGFVKRAFTNRRKVLVKNFSANEEWLLRELKRLGYGEKARAEEISVKDFQALFESWRREPSK